MSVDALDADRLRQMMVESACSDAGRGGRSLLVVDSRPFTSFNASHVAGAVNVHCPSIVRRRAGGLIPVVNVVRSAEALADLTAGRCRAVVVCDESTDSVDQLDGQSNARLALNSLASVLPPSTALYLLRGIFITLFRICCCAKYTKIHLPDHAQVLIRS